MSQSLYSFLSQFHNHHNHHNHHMIDLLFGLKHRKRWFDILIAANVHDIFMFCLARFLGFNMLEHGYRNYLCRRLPVVYFIMKRPSTSFWFPSTWLTGCSFVKYTVSFGHESIRLVIQLPWGVFHRAISCSSVIFSNKYLWRLFSL